MIFTMQFFLALFSLALAAPIADNEDCPASCSPVAKYSTLQYRLKNWETLDTAKCTKDPAAQIAFCNTFIALRSDCEPTDTDVQLHKKIDFWDIHRDTVNRKVGFEKANLCRTFLDKNQQPPVVTY